MDLNELRRELDSMEPDDVNFKHPYFDLLLKIEMVKELRGIYELLDTKLPEPE